MKKTVLCAAFAMVFGFGVYANVAGAGNAPDVVVYGENSKQGKVTFNHKAHQDKLGDCAKCHEGTPGKIEINKDIAHKGGCKNCHTEMGGPTKCGDCHKK
jgi:hypothetical protein